MIARVASAILVGVEARLVEVQVDLSRKGLPGTPTVGLPGASVRESQERVRIAIRNSGLGGEPARITVNLAPADLPKQGSSLDLAVAAAVLLAERGGRAREGWVVAGELALDGALRPVPGALPMALAARAAGCAGILLPDPSAPEAAAVGGIPVAPARDLAEAYAFLAGETESRPVVARERPSPGIRAARARTFPTCAARRADGGPSRWPPPDAITSCSSARRAPARRCSRGGWGRSFPR